MHAWNHPHAILSMELIYLHVCDMVLSNAVIELWHNYVEVVPFGHMCKLELKAVKSRVTDSDGMMKHTLFMVPGIVFISVALKELHILGEVGQGAFGHVYKAIWRGTIVAAKEIQTARNKKVLDNERIVVLMHYIPLMLGKIGH